MSDGGWVSTHEDITEAKRREESFRLLFQGSPMPMWAMDRRTLKFLAVNDAAIEHYGYSREQFLVDDRARSAAGRRSRKVHDVLTRVVAVG